MMGDIADRGSNDPNVYLLKLYMRDCAPYRLVTRAQEVELAAKIKNGNRKVRKEARETMIMANVRFVITVAKRYRECGLPFLDLISEGNIGLMKAVEKFDPAKGAKLSTYAVWWIKQAIRQALSRQSRTICIPAHKVGAIAKYRLRVSQLWSEFGREPTDEEVGDELGLSAKKVERLRLAAPQCMSLDEPVQHKWHTVPLYETICDDQAESPSALCEGQNDLQILSRAIRSLPKRYQCIIEYRFGLNGYRAHTLEEIGKMHHLTRERIRQIVGIVMRQMSTYFRRADNPLLPVDD